jgi:hypothetical protein
VPKFRSHSSTSELGDFGLVVCLSVCQFPDLEMGVIIAQFPQGLLWGSNDLRYVNHLEWYQAHRKHHGM